MADDSDNAELLNDLVERAMNAGADAADDERPEVLRIPCGSRAERSEKVQETS